MATIVMVGGADRYGWMVPDVGDQIAVLSTDPPRLAGLNGLLTRKAKLAVVTAVRPMGGIVVKSNQGPDILLDKTSCHAWVRVEQPPVFQFALGQQNVGLGGWLTAWTAA